jgi:micrococcal nuclease
VERRNPSSVLRLLVAICAIGTLLLVGAPPIAAETVTATLVRILDGDTLEVAIATPTREPRIEVRRVRLLGIDAPESGQDGGPEATLFVREWIGNVPDMVIEIESTDRYGRLIGEVRRPVPSGGLSLNAALVAQGHAWWYREYAADRDDLARLERSARESRRGLWSAADPVEPWVWRQRR